MSVETQLHLDASAGTFTFNRVQDVEPIIEHNKTLQKMPQKRLASFHHIASVPNIFLEKWLNEEHDRGNVGLRLFSAEFDALVLRKVRDPDYAFLRVTDKRF